MLKVIGDASGVQAGQCGQGLGGVAQFGVVVVLDDPDAVAPRPGHECEPTIDGQRAAERVLVRRGEVNQPGRKVRVGSVRPHAFFVHRHRLQGQAGGHEGLDRAPVGRVFHPHRIALVGQQAGFFFGGGIGGRFEAGQAGVELVETNFATKGVRAIAFMDSVMLAPGQAGRMVWVKDR